MSSNFITFAQRDVKVTHYARDDNKVHGRFGSNATSCGVDIDPAYYTAAIPMRAASTAGKQDGSKFYHHEDPYKMGDVLLLESPKGRILVLATDRGTLPYGAVDLVQGVATQALGQEEDVAVTKLGSIRALGEGDDRLSRAKILAMRELIRDINEGKNGKTAASLLNATIQGEPLMAQRASNVEWNSLRITSAPVDKDCPPKQVTTGRGVTSTATLQHLLEQAGLATDKGGADDKVDDVKGKITRSAIKEARILLQLDSGDDAQLISMLQNGSKLAALKVKVDEAKHAGEINAQGFVLSQPKMVAR